MNLIVKGKIEGKRKGFTWLIVTFLCMVIIIPTVLGASNIDLQKNERIKSTDTSSSFETMKSGKVFSQLLQNKLQKNSHPLGLFSSTIYTNCNGLEKSTEVIFGLLNDIDVDNNPGTGVNGADIRVQYLLLPWIELDPILAIGGLFTIMVERLGEEIKNADFQVAMELQLDTTSIRIGYHSLQEEENEIPNRAQVAFILLFALTERTKGFGFYFDPTYNTGNNGKKIQLFAELNDGTDHERFSLSFEPAIQTQLKIISTKVEGQWQYSFSRMSSENSKVTVQRITKENGQEKNVTLIIDKLPQIFSFTLALTPFGLEGGSLLYESSEQYNIELIVKSNQLGSCRYATIKNTPTRVFAEWTPTVLNGFYSVDIETTGTDLIIQNSETDPSIILTVNDLGNYSFYSTWNLTNPGDFTVYRQRELSVDLDFRIGGWIAKLTAQPPADYIATKWLVDVTGYLTFDTNLESLGTIDLLIKGEELGLQTIGESFKAEDWRIDWTLWPPVDWNLERTGTLTFTSIAIDLYLKNYGWLHLWPW